MLENWKVLKTMKHLLLIETIKIYKNRYSIKLKVRWNKYWRGNFYLSQVTEKEMQENISSFWLNNINYFSKILVLYNIITSYIIDQQRHSLMWKEERCEMGREVTGKVFYEQEFHRVIHEIRDFRRRPMGRADIWPIV